MITKINPHKIVKIPLISKVSLPDFNIAFTYPEIRRMVARADEINARLYGICSESDSNKA
jgi:hypothetical protein